MKKIPALIFGVLALAALCVPSAFPYPYGEGDKNVTDADGLRQGAWILTAGMLKLGAPWTPDQKVCEGTYTDSYRTDMWIEYNQSGDKITEWTYDQNGQEVNIKRYRNSALVSECNYTHKVYLVPHTFTMNGKTYQSREMIEYKTHNGIAKTFYPDGTLWSEMTWKDGRLDGPAKTYYPNGKLCEEGNWKHHFWGGDYRLYDKNGKEIK